MSKQIACEAVEIIPPEKRIPAIQIRQFFGRTDLSRSKLFVLTVPVSVSKLTVLTVYRFDRLPFCRLPFWPFCHFAVLTVLPFYRFRFNPFPFDSVSNSFWIRFGLIPFWLRFAVSVWSPFWLDSVWLRFRSENFLKTFCLGLMLVRNTFLLPFPA